MPAIPLGRKIFFMAQLRKDLRRSIQSAEERIGRGLDGVALRHMEGRLAELLNGDILSPGAADGLSRALDASAGRYDDSAILRALPDPKTFGAHPTDVGRLRALSVHMLKLEPAAFSSQLHDLLDALEGRSAEFEDEEFGFPRLNGWCSVVNNTAGFVHYANRHFLYRLGHVIEATDIAARLESLIIAGVRELDRRFDRKVDCPSAWAAIVKEQDASPRSRLANAISYVARDAYAFESASPLDRLSEALGTDHFDIIMRVAAYPVIPFSSRDDGLYLQIMSTVDELESYFTSTGPESYLELMNRPFERSQPAATLFSYLLKSAAALSRKDTVERVKSALNLSDDELGRASGASSKVLPPSLRQEEAGVDTSPNARAKAVLDWLGGGQRPARKMSAASLLCDVGDLEAATTLLPSREESGLLNFGELYTYLQLASKLLGRVELERTLVAVRRHLVRRSKLELGNISFAARVMQFSELAEDHRILENANYAYDAIPSPAPAGARQDRRRVVLFAIDQCRVTPALAVPLVPALAEAGAEFFSLQQGRFVNSVVRPWTASPQLSRDSGSLVGQSLHRSELHNEWRIDLPNCIVECDGVNYYQGIYEKVARTLKVYTVDWELPATKVWFLGSLTKVDRTVAALDGVRQVAERDNLAVRFATLQSQFAPASAIRTYCQAHPDHLEHVTLSSSYENWRTNVGGEPLSTLTMLNNTRHPEPSIPAFGIAEDFRRWFETEFTSNIDHYRQMNRELTGMDRAGARTEEADGVVERMRSDKVAGRKVFCLLGKIPYDLAVPYQGGPAHDSMADWLNHTVDVIGTSGNRLYVKPHPHEFTLSISAKTIESFVEMIERPDTAGVEVLPHRGVNLQDLMPVVDLFLCWNGSSIAEIGSQGASILAADDWATKNYPIHVAAPRDRAHYEDILRGQVEMPMHPEFELLSIAYTCYLTEAPFAFRIPFIDRSSTNTQFNRAMVAFDRITKPSLDAVLLRASDIAETFGFV